MAEDELVNDELAEEKSGLTDDGTLKTGAFLVGVNAGFLAGAEAGEALREVSITFALAALGMRAAPGRFSQITEAPYFALAGYAVGVIAGYGLAHPDEVSALLSGAGQ